MELLVLKNLARLIRGLEGRDEFGRKGFSVLVYYDVMIYEM